MEIKITGQRLEAVENFKYLGAIIYNEGSTPEILSRIAQTAAALSGLKIIRRDKIISLASKVKLMQTLILSTFLYVCESCTWQQNSREGSKPLRWDAIGNFWTFPTKTMCERGGSQQNPECNWSGWWRNGNSDGMATSQDPLAWRRNFCRGQWKEQDGEKEEMGRYRQGMDRNEVWRFPEGREDRERWKGIVATSSVVSRRPTEMRLDERCAGGQWIN